MSDGTPSDNAIGNDSDTVLQHMNDVMVDVVDFGIGDHVVNRHPSATFGTDLEFSVSPPRFRQICHRSQIQPVIVCAFLLMLRGPFRVGGSTDEFYVERIGGNLEFRCHISDELGFVFFI